MSTTPHIYHLAFCINDKYVKYLLVTLRSLTESNCGIPYHIHILTDHISDYNNERIRKCLVRAGMTFTVHNIDDTSLSNLKTNGFTIYAWYRLLLPKILGSDVDRILYLDTDIVISGNISELFDLDMEGKAIAAVVDDNVNHDILYEQADIPNNGRYICTGVLMMNLDYWRKQNLSEKIINWALDNYDRIEYPDQDAINHVCVDTLVLLPLKYDIEPNFFVNPYFAEHYHNELVECLTDPRIIHYNHISPWYSECRHPLLKYWRNINKRKRPFHIWIKSRDEKNWFMRIRKVLWYWRHAGFCDNLYEDTAKKILPKR